MANGIATAKPVASWSTTEKLGKALRRSLPLLPADVRDQVAALIEPESLAIIGGTIVVWAGSHFIGIGEIVDVILLVVGGLFLGRAAWDAGSELYSFASDTVNAKSEQDLDRAAHHFAKAVAIIGINAVMAILFHKAGKAVKARGVPKIQDAWVDAGAPPKTGTGPEPLRAKPTVTVDPTLPAGEGVTSWYGDVEISSKGSAADQALVRNHEAVHSLLSPKLRILRQFRASLKATGYNRSALLQYLEEALAETYAQIRVRGLEGTLTGIKFPVKNGYITIGQIGAEANAIGTIVLGGRSWAVYFQPGPGSDEENQ